MKKIIIILILYLILIISYQSKILAQENTIFKTNLFRFSSEDNRFFYNIQVLKKVNKSDVYYEFYIKTESKIFINLEKSSLIIETEKKAIKLKQIRKSYKNRFDKDNNIWLEEIRTICDYFDFEKFLGSNSNFLIIKTYDLNLKNKIPEEFIQDILQLINYSKEIGKDVEKQYQPFLFFGFANISLNSIYIINAAFSDYGIEPNTLFHNGYDIPFVFGFISNYFSFQFYIPFKFLIFSYLNLYLYYSSYPHNIADSNSLYLFDCLGIFAGPTIKLFTLFKFITLKAGIYPGIFFTLIYDTIESSFYPNLSGSAISEMLAARATITIDFKISETFLFALSINTLINLFGFNMNFIEFSTIIGF